MPAVAERAVNLLDCQTELCSLNKNGDYRASWSRDFPLTAALTAPLCAALPPPHLGNPQRRRIGRPGCCQHHLCHLSCSAASCSSCDKTSVYSEAENPPLNLAAGRSLSSSYSSLSVRAEAERVCL